MPRLARGLGIAREPRAGAAQLVPEVDALERAVRHREADVAVETAAHLAQVLAGRHEVQAHVAGARDVLRAEQVLAERREIHVVEILLDVHARRSPLRLVRECRR